MSTLIEEREELVEKNSELEKRITDAQSNQGRLRLKPNPFTFIFRQLNENSFHVFGQRGSFCVL